MRVLTVHDISRSMVPHNRDFYRLLRGGVPVEYRDAHGRRKSTRVRVLDFDNAPGANRFLAVRELKLTGIRTPNYNRRADLVCFVNGLPLVFIELKAVYKNIREGFDNNLSDYMDENVIAHAFHHNAFLIVSNGDRARYGSITGGWEHFAEWKRLDEADRGSLDAEVLLNGMLAHDRLLDIVENFILFDDSKPGATRKIIARNHQVLGVNRAVASVTRQEELKLEYPPERRLKHRVVELPLELRAPAQSPPSLPKVAEPTPPPYLAKRPVAIVERTHPDLGRLGVFWHTQGSGKSYSMAFFAEKVRRKLEGNFTFLLMTDRNDLDGQIYGTFVGCGIADDNTPRATSGDDLEKLLKQNHRYVFSLIHKFNKDVDPKQPYSERDDIIVISDEAHRTQAGRLARNMRVALPNAAFIGFTGTPLFKQDEITKRIFGNYVSRYDFKRSEEDGATVKLVYENRGEKLGVARVDLNDRIAEKIEEAELDPDQGRCWRSCWARTTRSSPPTNGWTGSRPISSSTARPGGSRASRCWYASTRSPVPGCSSRSFLDGKLGRQRFGSRQTPSVRRPRRRVTTPSVLHWRRKRRRWPPRPRGWKRPSSRSSSVRRRTRSGTSRNGASTSFRIAP